PSPLGRPLNLLSLHTGMTLELVLKPAAEQVQCATLISNHPGAGFDGITIEQDGSTTNRYHVLLGDGQRWHRLATFDLLPDRWHHLALVLNRTNAELFLDGARIASFDVQAITPKDSPLPLSIGNWINGNRQFNGFVREVRLLAEDLPEAEIARNHI